MIQTLSLPFSHHYQYRFLYCQTFTRNHHPSRQNSSANSPLSLSSHILTVSSLILVCIMQFWGTVVNTSCFLVLILFRFFPTIRICIVYFLFFFITLIVYLCSTIVCPFSSLVSFLLFANGSV